MRTPFALVFVLMFASASIADSGPLRVCMLSGSEEYESDTSLAAFQKYLETNYPARCTLLKAQGVDRLPGLEALDDCDVALFFTRRLTIDGDALAKVKKYVESGRPLVGVRTASHGFQNWLEFDKRVLGDNYRGHYRNDLAARAAVVSAASGHPVLDGVKGLASRGSLYKTSPLAADANLLMVGTSPEGKEPVAWTREYKGARVFYTSLGAQGDFDNATFRRMLANALFWAARREIERKPLSQPALRSRPEGTLHLKLRSRIEATDSRGEWKETHEVRDLPVAETAIIICDMWDNHWCRGATERCDAIAKNMAPVIATARAKGVQIVHAPSDCMDFYADTPQRRRMQLAPAAKPPAPLEIKEPALPIDDSDGGCDTGDAMYLAWTRQNPRIDIGEFDGISDNGAEVYNLVQQLGIKNLIVVGVHTNMCVLGRSFAIRQMTKWGVRCVLVRDLTDTMYNPKMRPFVAHEKGTDLVVEHIEKYWAPSTTSAELIEALPR
jgi:type 1 glutamine amidotransferase/nicotinamidase-related amidase